MAWFRAWLRYSGPWARTGYWPSLGRLVTRVSPPYPGSRQVPLFPLVIMSPGAPLGCGSWQPSPLTVLRTRFLLELEKAPLCFFPCHGPGGRPGGEVARAWQCRQQGGLHLAVPPGPVT